MMVYQSRTVACYKNVVLTVRDPIFHLEVLISSSFAKLGCITMHVPIHMLNKNGTRLKDAPV